MRFSRSCSLVLPPEQATSRAQWPFVARFVAFSRMSLVRTAIARFSSRPAGDRRRDARAQVVRGFVSEPAAGTPVAGALVTLVDSAGHEYARGITASSGSFTLAGTPGGVRHVQVARIGYRAWRSEAFTAGMHDTVQFRLLVEDLPVRLPEITARSERSCASLESAADRVVVLWEEARKAISLADLSYQRDPMQYRVDRRNSRSDDEEHLLSDSIRTVNLQARWPVEALPAGALLHEGFVQRDKIGGLVYYGPDLSVLYAPEFLATHCLAAVAGDSGSNLVGVSYRPSEEEDPRMSRVPSGWTPLRCSSGASSSATPASIIGCRRAVPAVSFASSAWTMGGGSSTAGACGRRSPVSAGSTRRCSGSPPMEEVVVAVSGPGGVTLWQGTGLARGDALATEGWTGAPRVRGTVAVLGSPIELDNERIKGSQAHIVSARNRSDRPVRITGLALYSCVNVLQRLRRRRYRCPALSREERALLEVRPWMPGRPCAIRSRITGELNSPIAHSDLPPYPVGLSGFNIFR